MKPLTVKELIEKLQKCDPEMEVYFNYNELTMPCESIEVLWRCQGEPHYYTFDEFNKRRMNISDDYEIEKVVFIDTGEE